MPPRSRRPPLRCSRRSTSVVSRETGECPSSHAFITGRAVASASACHTSFRRCLPLEVTLKIRIASQELAMQSGYLRYREFALNELQQFLQRPQHDGQGMVEYALILVLIAIVVIVILSTVGKQGNNVFSNISKGLGS